MEPKFLSRRQAIHGISTAGLALTVAASRALADEEQQQHEEYWPPLAKEIFGDKPINDGAGVVALDTPYRAEDAATVPVTMRALPGAVTGAPVRALTLVIDENPSPLVARFELAAQSGIDTITTNVRVDSYTNVHLIAERADGSLWAVKRFVKAAGGCSAPAGKQQAADVALGTMRFRLFAGATPEAQLMIRHPNASGMQMDQITHYYIPAHFVRRLRVWQGDEPMLAVESGISIAENPEFRFSYRPNGAKTFRAEAVDSEGATFSGQWPATPAT